MGTALRNCQKVFENSSEGTTFENFQKGKKVNSSEKLPKDV